jgi:2-amino-1-hydroxyethylphosphonate dioxygenase (glycine-forming)
MSKSNIEQTIEEIFDLYEKFGHAEYIGEPVSQLEHMSQSAQLAMDEGYPDEIVLAAFFHDVGHFCSPSRTSESMNGFGTIRHESKGSAFLREKGFPEIITRLVENHVQAKRYLTHKFPHYFESLSNASKKTLSFQGGVMSAMEADAFEKDPLFEYSIRIRYWDELAKETGVPVMDLNILKEKAKSVLQKTSNLLYRSSIA